ncbi:MAG: hypothetical protein JW395_1972 [Nitrospira sp.]|nr:hypothetical protein [Nitrospira sp.]
MVQIGAELLCKGGKVNDVEKITEYGVRRTDLKRVTTERGSRGPGGIRGGHKRPRAVAQFEADKDRT